MEDFGETRSFFECLRGEDRKDIKEQGLYFCKYVYVQYYVGYMLGTKANSKQCKKKLKMRKYKSQIRSDLVRHLRIISICSGEKTTT